MATGPCYRRPWWTAVDGQRFAGTCYRAANWILLAGTQGRGPHGPSSPSGRLRSQAAVSLSLYRGVQQRLREAQRPCFSEVEAEANWA